MAHTVEEARRTREDRLWESALTQLTAEGVMASGEADVVRERHDEMVLQAQNESRRTRIVELAAYAGAALTIVGLSAISSRVWERFDESMQVLLLSGLALGMLVAATLIAALTPGGAATLKGHAEAARRRLVGVLGIAGAGLAAGSLVLAFQTYLPQGSETHWMPLAFVFGLAFAVVTSRFVPGVVPTLAVMGFLGACAITAIDAFGRIDTVWAVPLAGVTLGAFGALVLARLLTPVILVEAVAIAVWLGGAAGGLSADPSWLAQPGEADVAIWIGRVGLAILVIAGGWLFTQGANWPWAVGSAVGLALLVQFTFAGALGGAVAMIIAGVVLVATSVLLARTHKQPIEPEPGGPGIPNPCANS